MANDFLLNLGVAAYGLAAGTAVAVALFGAWRHRPGVIVGSIIVAAWTMFLGLRMAPPGMYSADRLRPWLVAVGAGSALICTGLIAVWQWRRTWLSAVMSFALGALILYGLASGPVAYVTYIE